MTSICLRRVILTILFVSGALSALSCSSSTHSLEPEYQIVRLPEYYAGEGAIVPESDTTWMDGTIGRRITPTIRQVETAELILVSGLYSHYRRFHSDHRLAFDTEDSISALNHLVITVMNDIRAKYNRWYSGFVNKSGETVIQIDLFDLSVPGARALFKNWRHEVISGAGEIFEQSRKTYLINLDRDELEFR
jgi:hypothetical protein